MPPDPFEVLGIAADATLGEARVAYRRAVALFHPDHLQGMEADVKAEGERRFREATEALEAIQAGYMAGPGAGPRSRPSPSDSDTEPGLRTFNAQVREVRDGGLHADWLGRHAGAMWSALRRAHAMDDLVQQVEWGTYECTLAGSGVRQLLSTVLVNEGWQDEPLETVDLGHRRLVGLGASEPPGARNLGWLSDNVSDRQHYVVTAEVF